MYDVLVHRLPIEQMLHKGEVDLAVSSIDLAGAELALSSLIGRERALEKALAPVKRRLRLDPHRHAAVARPADDQRARRLRRRDRARAVRVPLPARPRPAREHAEHDPREPQPRRRDPGDPADDVRRPDAALPRGGRDPRGELRRPRVQDADPEDDPLRRGAREGTPASSSTTPPAPPPRRTATWRRRSSMARKRASMREGPLAELFRATEAAQKQAEAGREPDARRASCSTSPSSHSRTTSQSRSSRPDRVAPSRCARQPSADRAPRRSRRRAASARGARRAATRRLEPLPEPPPRLCTRRGPTPARTSRSSASSASAAPA